MSEAKRKRKSYSEISEEEKEYRKDWYSKNIVKVGVGIRRELRDEFSQACKKLGITQYSIIKTAIDETIEKANQLE